MPGVIELIQRVGEVALVEAGGHGDRTAKRLEVTAGHRVPIAGDQETGRSQEFRHRSGMAAGAERTVENPAVRGQVEHLEELVGEDGHVRHGHLHLEG